MWYPSLNVNPLQGCAMWYPPAGSMKMRDVVPLMAVVPLKGMVGQARLIFYLESEVYPGVNLCEHSVHLCVPLPPLIRRCRHVRVCFNDPL